MSTSDQSQPKIAMRSDGKMAFRMGLVSLGIWAAISASPLQAYAANTESEEVLVSSKLIIDYEFDWGRDGVLCTTCNGGAGNARFAFTDSKKNLWVGQVDFQTGAFTPENGKDEQVDTLTALPIDFGNGPEWMFSAAGSKIVYTKYKPKETPSKDTAGIASASRGSDGVWKSGFYKDGMGRLSPIGTVVVDDPAPRLQYQNLDKSVTYWRADAKGSPEGTVLVSGNTGGSRRWVQGTHKIILTGDGLPGTGGEGHSQVFLYDTDTGANPVQLTNEPTNCSGAMMWPAPEYNNDFVFFCVKDGKDSKDVKTLAIFRQTTASSGGTVWSRIFDIAMPSQYPYIWSPEYFIHNGKSYIFFQMNPTASPTNFKKANQLAMVGILPENTELTILTPSNAEERYRLDPEYFITAQGPFIYYNRYYLTTTTTPSATTSGQSAQHEGVYRVDTKLGAPVAAAH